MAAAEEGQLRQFMLRALDGRARTQKDVCGFRTSPAGLRDTVTRCPQFLLATTVRFFMWKNIDYAP